MFICASVFVILASLSFVALNFESTGSRKRKCADHLRLIGAYFATYEAKYSRYPHFGARTWFGDLWASGIATDGDVFRCPCVKDHGPGTHYLGLAQMLSTHPSQGEICARVGSTSNAALPDWPMACDDDYDGHPNHPDATRNVLQFSGVVFECTIGDNADQHLYVLGRMNWAAPAGTK